MTEDIATRVWWWQMRTHRFKRAAAQQSITFVLIYSIDTRVITPGPCMAEATMWPISGTPTSGTQPMIPPPRYVVSRTTSCQPLRSSNLSAPPRRKIGLSLILALCLESQNGCSLRWRFCQLYKWTANGCWDFLKTSNSLLQRWLQLGQVVLHARSSRWIGYWHYWQAAHGELHVGRSSALPQNQKLARIVMTTIPALSFRIHTVHNKTLHSRAEQSSERGSHRDPGGSMRDPGASKRDRHPGSGRRDPSGSRTDPQGRTTDLGGSKTDAGGSRTDPSGSSTVPRGSKTDPGSSKTDPGGSRIDMAGSSAVKGKMMFYFPTRLRCSHTSGHYQRHRTSGRACVSFRRDRPSRGRLFSVCSVLATSAM